MKKYQGRRTPKAPGGASLFSVTGDDLEARRVQRLATKTLLQEGRTPLQVIQIGQQAEGIAAKAVADAVTREPPRRPVACAEGCAWCCYQRVGVAVPEVARIADHLRAVLAPLDIQATLERLEQTLAQRRQRPPAPVPCPLLVNNRCSVYPVRPLTCRGFNSSDASVCQSSVSGASRAIVPVYPPQLRLTSLVLDGMRAGITESGLKGELLELAAALQIALTVEDAVARWLEGKAPFASARLI